MSTAFTDSVRWIIVLLYTAQVEKCESGRNFVFSPLPQRWIVLVNPLRAVRTECTESTIYCMFVVYTEC